LKGVLRKMKVPSLESFIPLRSIQDSRDGTKKEILIEMCPVKLYHLIELIQRDYYKNIK